MTGDEEALRALVREIAVLQDRVAKLEAEAEARNRADAKLAEGLRQMADEDRRRDLERLKRP